MCLSLSFASGPGGPPASLIYRQRVSRDPRTPPLIVTYRIGAELLFSGPFSQSIEMLLPSNCCQRGSKELLKSSYGSGCLLPGQYLSLLAAGGAVGGCRVPRCRLLEDSHPRDSEKTSFHGVCVSWHCQCPRPPGHTCSPWTRGGSWCEGVVNDLQDLGLCWVTLG